VVFYCEEEKVISMRETKFVNGEYYHIYNRGVDKRKVFLDDKDYIRFIKSIREFNRPDPIGSLYEKEYKERKGLGPQLGTESLSKPLVEFICYCFNPNHYHFLLRQLTNKGIEKFMHKLGSGYTTYFNKKHNRSGSLFQGKFKSIHIDSDEYLTWLSAYININPKLHNITNNLEKYSWSSYQDYTGKRLGALCNKDIILSQFPHKNYTYEYFLDTCLPGMKERKELQKYFMEK